MVARVMVEQMAVAEECPASGQRWMRPMAVRGVALVLTVCGAVLGDGVGKDAYLRVYRLRERFCDSGVVMTWQEDLQVLCGPAVCLAAVALAVWCARKTTVLGAGLLTAGAILPFRAGLGFLFHSGMGWPGIVLGIASMAVAVALLATAVAVWRRRVRNGEVTRPRGEWPPLAVVTAVLAFAATLTMTVVMAAAHNDSSAMVPWSHPACHRPKLVSHQQ